MKLAGRSFCVSFAYKREVDLAHEIGQSVMLDNGAFTHWRQGHGVIDVEAYVEWITPYLDHKTTWCVIPDVIDGDEDANDEMLLDWMDLGLPPEQCAPVWHMHESINRLQNLTEMWPLVCVGSSGEYASVYTKKWHTRMHEAFDAICDEQGRVPCKLHMLRGLGIGGSVYPFYSADSTNIARNWNLGKRGGKRCVREMADRIDAKNTPARWCVTPEQRSALTEAGKLHKAPAPKKKLPITETRRSLVTGDGIKVYYGNP